MTLPASCWKELWVAGRERLERAGIAEAENKMQWLAAHLLQCGLLDTVRFLSDTPTPEMAARFSSALARLENDEPVQYVIGETDFMGLRFRCDSRGLIPRPETEVLVACAEDFLRTRTSSVVVDVCTGSGCIAIALALRVPSARVIATDISPAALDLARENARALGAKIEFRQADLLAGQPENSADLVIANPPYVATKTVAQLDRTVRDFEPFLALDGGPDGFLYISRLVEQAAHVLQSEGRLMLEIGDDQGPAVTEILCKTTQFQILTLQSDYAGRDRVALAKRKPR